MRAIDRMKLHSVLITYHLRNAATLLKRGSSLREVIYTAIQEESDIHTVMRIAVAENLYELGIYLLKYVSEDTLAFCDYSDLGDLCRHVFESGTTEDKKRLQIYLEGITCPALALKFIEGTHELSIPNCTNESLAKVVAENGDKIVRKKAIVLYENGFINIPRNLIRRMGRIALTAIRIN